jgi:catechol 2,3-dioxygenase-like lactoylglutathione lyase family enzyme
VATVSVRYIVHDVDEAITYYTGALGFTEVMHPAPSFAMLARGDLRQVIAEDPSGNPVELFQPTRDEARLSGGVSRPAADVSRRPGPG